MNDDIEQLLSVGIKKELKLYVDMPNIYIGSWSEYGKNK